jgi:hypothetical protein
MKAIVDKFPKTSYSAHVSPVETAFGQTPLDGLIFTHLIDRLAARHVADIHGRVPGLLRIVKHKPAIYPRLWTAVMPCRLCTIAAIQTSG